MPGARVLFSWNANREALRPPDTIKEPFEEQVARSPRAQAIVFDGERLTFESA